MNDHASARHARLLVALAALMLTGLVGACGGDDNGVNLDDGRAITGHKLIAVDANCDNLRGHIVDYVTEMALQERYPQWGVGRGGDCLDGGCWDEGDFDDAPVSGADGTDGMSSGDGSAPPNNGGTGGEAGDDGAESPGDFTGTNVQEVGVDEADIIKTDGDFIYTINGGDLIIISSWPAEQTAEVARLTLGGASGYHGGGLDGGFDGGFDGGARPEPAPMPSDDGGVTDGASDGGTTTPNDGDGGGADFCEGCDPNVPTDDAWHDQWVSELYIHNGDPATPADDRALVFAEYYRYDSMSGNGSSGTRLIFVDISDRANPAIERQLEFEASLASSRMIGEDVHVVLNGQLRSDSSLESLGGLIWSYTSSAGDDLGLPAAVFETEEERQALIAQARPILRAQIAQDMAGLDINALMPRRRALDAAGQALSDEAMAACGALYLPPVYAELGLLTVARVSMHDASVLDTTGVVASGWQVYASNENLYVTMSSNEWWREDWTVETHIHKFDLDGGVGGAPTYAASGSVDGWTLNQFSMSEYAGHLRVATTDERWGGEVTASGEAPQGGNHLFVLQDQGGELVEVGSVRGIEPDEQIFSARMIGPRGFIVTFRQTDPLFTFDLSDPTNPQLLGELHVNGFSSYIHPLGDDHLLTIGRDGTSDGQILGVQLQIFDVSDLANPTRAHQEVITANGWSDSEALWDHRAFTFHPERGVLAVPAYVDGYDEATGQHRTSSNLSLYQVDAAAGFTHLGDVTHDDLNASGDYYYWNTMRRSLFIEDFVYSLSELGLKVNDLLDPATERAAVSFAPATSPAP